MEERLGDVDASVHVGDGIFHVVLRRVVPVDVAAAAAGGCCRSRPGGRFCAEHFGRSSRLTEGRSWRVEVMPTQSLIIVAVFVFVSDHIPSSCEAIP